MRPGGFSMRKSGRRSAFSVNPTRNSPYLPPDVHRRPSKIDNDNEHEDEDDWGRKRGLGRVRLRPNRGFLVALP